MNTTQTTRTSKKIPEVKHFYDSNAAKKAKKLAKKALNSNLVKHATGKRSGGRKSSKEGIVDRAIAAPIAVQVGTAAVLAAGGYALWKNRSKIQEMVSGLFSSEAESSSELT